MIVRLAVGLFISRCLFAQCDDVAVSGKRAGHFSEVVFQGTNAAFHGSAADRTVVFRVSPRLERTGRLDFEVRQKSMLVTNATDIAQLGRWHKPKR